MNKPGNAIIDRITDGVATLLVGEDEIVVDIDTLPEGVKEGDWFKVDAALAFRTGQFVRIILIESFFKEKFQCGVCFCHCFCYRF